MTKVQFNEEMLKQTKLWEDKMTKEMSSFESKMSIIKNKYKQEMEKKQNEQKQEKNTQKEMTKKEMDSLKDSIDNLNKLHEQEVQNVFEDEKTLAFISKMRGFKKSWQKNKVINKRKQTAGQMAEATKLWISAYE